MGAMLLPLIAFNSTATSKPPPQQIGQAASNPYATFMRQLSQCWMTPAGGWSAKKPAPTFRVALNKDGTIRSATQLDSARNSDPVFKEAADAASRALHNPSCQPFKLPPDKYEEWKSLIITFDPKE